MKKYTQDYKKKEPAYFQAGFTDKKVYYKNGCKIITYTRPELTFEERQKQLKKKRKL